MRKTKLSIILTSYKRLNNMLGIIGSLSRQDYLDFDLHIINNDFSNTKNVISVVRDAEKFHDINFEIIFHHRSTNDFCMTRYEVAFNMSNPDKYILFLDDDQILNSPVVLSKYIDSIDKNKNSVIGWWAWRIARTNEFFLDIRGKDNEQVDYVGGGGMFFNSMCIGVDFFTTIPDKLKLHDDIWSSYYFKSKGYELRSVEVDIEMNGNDDVAMCNTVCKGQYHEAYKIVRELGFRRLHETMCVFCQEQYKDFVPENFLHQYLHKVRTGEAGIQGLHKFIQSYLDRMLEYSDLYRCMCDVDYFMKTYAITFEKNNDIKK